MAVEDSWKQNRNSSKAWIVLLFLMFLPYAACNILRLWVRKAGKQNYLPLKLTLMDSLIVVFERDMMPVFVCYAICIAFGGFFVFA